MYGLFIELWIHKRGRERASMNPRKAIRRWTYAHVHTHWWSKRSEIEWSAWMTSAFGNVRAPQSTHSYWKYSGHDKGKRIEYHSEISYRLKNWTALDEMKQTMEYSWVGPKIKCKQGQQEKLRTMWWYSYFMHAAEHSTFLWLFVYFVFFSLIFCQLLSSLPSLIFQ